MSNGKDQSDLGLMKLMLRMPALRGRMQILTMWNAEFRSLCGAFDGFAETATTRTLESSLNTRASAWKTTL
jgi:hypothetical protein